MTSGSVFGERRAALAAPAWTQQLADELGVVRFDSWDAAIHASRHQHIVALDVTRSGCDIDNRRDLLAALAQRHDRVIAVTRDAEKPDFLAPFLPEDELDTPGARHHHEELLSRLAFPGPDITRGELAALLDIPRPGHHRRPAFGAEYLRYERPIKPKTPVVAHKRMYTALDPTGQLVVAGAFARGFVPLEADWLCCHDGSPHDRIGPECYYGYSAYQNREDALRRSDPSAAVATVEFSQRVMSAGGGVVSPELRGEHQRVVALEFPTLCRTRACVAEGRPRPATRFAGSPVLDDEAGEYAEYIELIQMCEPCARRKHVQPAATTTLAPGPWTIADLTANLCPRVTLSWLDTPLARKFNKQTTPHGTVS